MENSRLLVPVVLSIMNSYKEQAANALKELKQVEYALSNAPKTDVVVSEKQRSELVKQMQELKSDLAEKEELVQGFSDIYESRSWACNHLVQTDIVLH